MRRDVVFTQTVVTSVEPERAIRVADECLVEIRVVENRKEVSGWVHECEISGEAGKVEKFVKRLKNLELLAQ